MNNRRVSAWAIGLPVLRVALVAAASALIWLIVRAFDLGFSLPALAVPFFLTEIGA